MDYLQVNERLKAAFPRISPQLRKAARHVLDHPEEVALNSMRRLAKQAGVHPSTMVRLAKTLGLSGYAELREPYRQHLRQGPDRYTARARDLQARGDGMSALFDELLELDIENLRVTARAIGADRLIRASRVLAGARAIYVVGTRSCFSIAYYFHYACRMFRDTVYLVEGTGGAFADDLRGIGEDDALLAISFEPYARETVMAARFGRGQGAAVVAITDSAVSPIAIDAAESLVVANASPSFFQSLTGPLATVQTLVALLVSRGGKEALAALENSESQLERFGAYWSSKNAEREGVS
ncbi:MAG: MurR/RpiR family transcriptional regulator [Alphaproteobacteria bacterium]